MLEWGKVYKYLEKYSCGFYSCKRALTYGRPVMICCGSRSIGKSTGWAMFLILSYLIYGRKWIYTRRTRDETELTAGSFFDNASNIIKSFGDFKDFAGVEYKGGEFFIVSDEGEKVKSGCAIPLSLEHKYKSSNLSEYFTILYDEFIPKFDTDYLGSRETPDKEYRKLLSLYQTVDRGIGTAYRNETGIVLLGNTATIYNPILIKLGVPEYVYSDSKIVAPKSKLWVLEKISEVEATKNISESFAYKLSDEIEKDYGYNNINKSDFGGEFIKRAKIGQYLATFRLNNKDYGLIVTDKDEWHITKARKDITVLYYSLDLVSHGGKNDLELLTIASRIPYIKMMKDHFNIGKLFWDNVQSMKEWLIILQYMRS